jgi:hypothetical protein
MFGAAEPGKILFELSDIRSQAERAIIERASKSCFDLLAQWAHLGEQIQVRNGFNLFSDKTH